MTTTREPLHLSSTPGSDTYRRSGRTRRIEETVELAWSVRGEAGISRLSDITDLDRIGLPVYNVYRPNAMDLNLTVSSGKGTSPLHSMASGLMEAIERHFGETQSLASSVMTLREAHATGRPVLDPRRLTPDVRRFPKLDDVFEWVDGTSAWGGPDVMIPASAIYTPYQRGGVRSYESHSDGLVSGNTRPEALLHGMLELIERDACSFGELLHHGARIERDTVTASVGDVWDRISGAGIDTQLFFFSSPTGVPVFYALGIDPDAHSAMLINAGAGASLDPERAALRALTELAQSRACVISGSREDFSTRYAGRKRISLQRALDCAREWGNRAWETWEWDRVPQLATGDLDADVDLVRHLLVAADLGEVYVVDLVPPDFPFAIMKVVIPGVEYVVEHRYRLGPRFHAAAVRAGYSGS